MKDLEFYRKNIDKIDKKLIKVLEKRFDIVSEIAEYKLANDIDIENTSRESEILDKVQSIANPEQAEYIVELYKTLFSESKKYQKKLNEEVNR